MPTHKYGLGIEEPEAWAARSAARAALARRPSAYAGVLTPTINNHTKAVRSMLMSSLRSSVITLVLPPQLRAELHTPRQVEPRRDTEGGDGAVPSWLSDVLVVIGVGQVQGVEEEPEPR